VLGDGRELLGLDFDIHGGGSTSSSRTTRTRSRRPRRRAASRSRGSGCTTAWSRSRREDGQVGRQHPLLGDALDRYGRDALVMYFLRGHYRQPLAVLGRAGRGRGRAVERVANFVRLDANATSSIRPGNGGRHREASSTHCRNDFNTRRRWRRCSS
jgi:cysteinyl-tRNA synthetase